MATQSFAYRGKITGLVAKGAYAAFITQHPEQQATALYRLDASTERVKFSIEALNSGGSALTLVQDTVWFVTEAGKLQQAPLGKGKSSVVAGLDFSAAPVLALTAIAQNGLAILQAKRLSLVQPKSGSVLQHFVLAEEATTLAANPDGTWVAVGDQKGNIAVYCLNEAQQWECASQANLHQGAVTALQFEAHELRFYSAGADKKLFSTHAQGELQALDKGRSSNHEQSIQAIHLGNERFFTGAVDKSIKAWPYAGGQPVTLKQGLASVTHLAQIDYQDKKCLLVATNNACLRFVELSKEERFEDIVLTIADGYDYAQQQLNQDDIKIREQAIDLLASYDDKAALAIAVKQARKETDKALREQILQAFVASKHKDSTEILEQFLSDNRHETVRQLAFAGLVKRAVKGDLQPFEKAIATNQPDIATLALQALAKLAKENAQATQLIQATLQHKDASLRLLSLSLLEQIDAKNSPKASLLALTGHFPDLKRAALIRLYQRKLLADSNVQRAVLMAQSDKDEMVRDTAFLVAIMSRTELEKALSSRDLGMRQRLSNLDYFDLLAKTHPTIEEKANENIKKGRVNLSDLKRLTNEDYAILLQGMTNRYADISFIAAYTLAILQDQRAFGLLLLMSQEPTANIRKGVCYAFARLQQLDCIPTLLLMLDDTETEVRAAAFSALQELQPDTLQAVQYGLQSNAEDIHARALKSLLDTLKSKPKPAQKEQALALLRTALNDPFTTIRQETFKACMNQQLGVNGDVASTLHFLLNSHFENIHQEVLNEVMANSTVLPPLAWVEPLLLSLLNDEFKQIRSAAFAFAVKEKKRFVLAHVLDTAVNSRFIDMRQLAFEQIKNKPNKANQQYLVTLLKDTEPSLREGAVNLLVEAQQVEHLQEALQSEYDDVQVFAAVAMASWQDSRAFAVLARLASCPEPHTQHDKAHWVKMSSQALLGLQYLGDKRAFPLLSAHLHGQEKALQRLAAEALPWVSDASHVESLLALQANELPALKIYASFALALLEQAQGKLLFSQDKLADYLSPPLLMAAQLCIAPVTPVTLKPYLTHPDTLVSALLVLAAHELLLHGETPHLTPWALGIPQTEVQLFCADLLSFYSDNTARWECVRQWLIQQHQEQKDERWEISLVALQKIAAVLVYADAHTKARLLALLSHLDKRSPYAEWVLHYDTFAKAYAEPIAQALAQVSEPHINAEQTLCNQKAFGAYLGLVRQESQSHLYRLRQQSLAVRLKALHAIERLAQRDKGLQDSIQQCLLSLLNYHQVEIRQFAWEKLQTLGMDLGQLAEIATTCSQQDIARQGVQLIVKHYPAAQARPLLQKWIAKDDYVLAMEAYRLLVEDMGLCAVSELALQSDSEQVRQQIVNELASQTPSTAIQAILLEATKNDRMSIAITAAYRLAMQSHPEAFSVLKRLLDVTPDIEQQRTLINALKQLRYPEVAEYLFAYWCDNEHKRMPMALFYRVLSAYREPRLFPKLLMRLETHPQESKLVLNTLLEITGYDQVIEDYDEESNDRQWLKKQYPRNDALLIQLFNYLVHQHHDADDVIELCHGVAWAQDKAADQALLAALPVVKDEVLEAIVTALCYRLEKRSGSAAGLLQALAHKNTDVQFLAAEGLANNGHAQGFHVLFAAIDYHPNQHYRGRAVLALGKLADERALDKILKIAENREHALHVSAIQAIGHMSNSEHQQRILQLLCSDLKKAQQLYNVPLLESVLQGLRWFNNLESWQVIAEFISSPIVSWLRSPAIELLQYWDSHVSRELLLNLLREEQDENTVRTALQTAKHLFATQEGQVSEVDYALLQGYCYHLDQHALKRVAEQASTERLLSLLLARKGDEIGADDELLTLLGNSLLQRQDHHDAALCQALASQRQSVIGIVARLLARMDKLSKKLSEALQQCTEDYYQQWQQQYQHYQQYANSSIKFAIEKKQVTLQYLLWACVQQGLFTPLVQQLLVTEQKEEQVFQAHLLQALSSLTTLSHKEILVQLQALLTANLPSVRDSANQLLSRHKPNNALQWTAFIHQPAHLSSPAFAPAISTAASQLAQQAQALPILIRQQDSQTLSNIAQDETQPDSVRQGAIEGLAKIFNSEAQQALTALKQVADKDMAAAAYRALRRQQRGLQKQTTLSLGVQ